MRITIYTLLFFFFFTIVASYGQEVIKEEAYTYESEDGKYFIQKHKPVYIYISNSPDSAAIKHRLRSKKSAQYTNPMQFDTDGFNSIRTYWAANNKQKKIEPPHEIIFEVYADSKPPETYGLFNKKTAGYKEGKRIYPKGTKLTLLEYDAVSGTSIIYYSINKKPFKNYIDPIEFNESAQVKFKFYGIDNVGNMEELHKLDFFIE